MAERLLVLRVHGDEFVLTCEHVQLLYAFCTPSSQIISSKKMKRERFDDWLTTQRHVQFII